MPSAIGRPYFLALLMMKDTFVNAAVAAFWAALFIFVAFGVSPTVLALALAPVAGMAGQRRNFAHGLHGVVNWHLWTLGTGAGLLRSQCDPRAPVAASVRAVSRTVRPDYSTLQ